MAELIAAAGGLVLGLLGTLIGAGGGFILAPALLLIEPEWNTEIVTAFSIAVVAANASAGASSYFRMRRIDLRSFPIFAAAAAPGAVAGALFTAFVPREVFNALFGCALLAIGVWLIVRPALRRARPPRPHHTCRDLTDAAGHHYVWSYDLRVGVLCSAGVGFLSSLLGIGGGIVHVPVLVTLLSFPEHIATATSHAVLAVTALIATVVHLVHGDYRTDAPLVIATSIGAVIGAPIGARLSNHVAGPVILRVLGAGLASVGVRLLFQVR